MIAITSGMRKIGYLLAVVLPVSLGACRASAAEDLALLACETILMDSLVSPSSYSRVSASIISSAVAIEYDASNRFGAILRDTHLCLFRLDQGEYVFLDDRSNDTPRCLALAEEEAAKNGYADVTKERIMSVCHSKYGEKVRIEMLAAGIQYPIQPSATALSE